MIVVTGLNEAQIEGLVRGKSSFEVVDLRGNFMEGIKLVETKIEALGMKCRVRTDVKGSLIQGGALGAVFSVVSTPATLAIATLTAAAGVGHTLATYDPDYEIVKDYVNKKLKVAYKKRTNKKQINLLK
ncbi:hypothetical protein [Pseudomonas asiatica]|uniref:hypothetical protein n=1 Tax=Pseudomonas asiatica TaxID=2219225 RepID=UPI000C23F878|nr:MULTISPECIES: hypothetical protein [Pseudomonas]PJI71320.1 hypothetical protein CSW00_23840 [Pseudomonas sp. MR 02]